MKGFRRAVQAEFYKGRHSFALWLSLFGTVANVVMFSLYYLFQPSSSNTPQADGWEAFIYLFYESVSFMMLPLYVIILCSLVTFQEHRPGTWVNLLSLPVTRWQLYLGKQTYILLHFIAAHLLFILGMLLVGLIIGIVVPASNLFSFPPIGLVLELASKTVLSILGLLAFHHWISWRFRPFIIPLTIGIIGFVFAALLGPDWVGAPWFWYATPIIYVPQEMGVVEYPSVPGLGLPYLSSMAWALIFTFLGGFNIKRLDMA